MMLPLCHVLKKGFVVLAAPHRNNIFSINVELFDLVSWCYITSMKMKPVMLYHCTWSWKRFGSVPNERLAGLSDVTSF